MTSDGSWDLLHRRYGTGGQAIYREQSGGSIALRDAPAVWGGMEDIALALLVDRGTGQAVLPDQRRSIRPGSASLSNPNPYQYASEDPLQNRAEVAGIGPAGAASVNFSFTEAAGVGVAQSFLFGNAGYYLGEEAVAQASQSSGYGFGLAVGIAGQVGLGFVSGGALGVGALGTTAVTGGRLALAARAAQLTYTGYAVAGDITAVYQSSIAFADGNFTPLHALGFAPTIGFAASAYRGVRGFSRNYARLSRNLGLAGAAVPRSLRVNSAEWKQLRNLNESDEALKLSIQGKNRGPNVRFGTESKLVYDPDNGIYDIVLRTVGKNGTRRVNLGIVAEEVQHALDRVNRVHPGNAAIRDMFRVVQERLPRRAPFAQAEDIVNNIWHVGVFYRLSDQLNDGNHSAF